MAETKNSFFQKLAAEWKKISWPTKKNAIRQTVVVVIVAAFAAAFICFFDTWAQYLINLVMYASFGA